MNQFTPLRDAAGNIIGMKGKDETDPVQQVLDASMQAVGAIPEVQPPVTAPAKRPLPPPPSFRLEIVVAVVCLVVVGLTFLPRRATAPIQISMPTVTAEPTRTPRPTMTPTNSLPTNPHAVTLSTGLLYGDYDENTRIGTAPEGLTCTLSGQSPDAQWAYLECPAPTGRVWARVADLELSADQRGVLMDSRILAHVVPTEGAFSPPPVQGSGPSLAFCAERSSIWGKTRQCGPTQRAADALADSQIAEINATAVALNKQR